jgi:hypothetical protein
VFKLSFGIKQKRVHQVNQKDPERFVIKIGKKRIGFIFERSKTFKHFMSLTNLRMLTSEVNLFRAIKNVPMKVANALTYHKKTTAPFSIDHSSRISRLIPVKKMNRGYLLDG